MISAGRGGYYLSHKGLSRGSVRGKPANPMSYRDINVVAQFNAVLGLQSPSREGSGILGKDRSR